MPEAFYIVGTGVHRCAHTYVRNVDVLHFPQPRNLGFLPFVLLQNLSFSSGMSGHPVATAAQLLSQALK